MECPPGASQLGDVVPFPGLLIPKAQQLCTVNSASVFRVPDRRAVQGHIFLVGGDILAG